MKRFWNRWLLCLTVTVPLCACGSSNGSAPASFGVPAMAPLWSVKASVFNHSTLFGPVLVSGDDKTTQITAVDVSSHQVAWRLPQKVDVIAGNNFAQDGQYLYATTRPAPGEAGLLVIAPDGSVVRGVTVPPRAATQTSEGPQIVGDRLYLIAGTELLAYDRKSLATPTPRLLWTRTLPGASVLVSMAFDAAGNQYLSTRDAHLYALDQAGTVRWSVNLSRQGVTNLVAADAIAVSGETLFATSGGGLLEAFSAVDGTPRWNSVWPSFDVCRTGAASFASYLEVGHGKVFVSPDGGACLSAFDAATGRPAWVFEAPNRYTFGSQPLYLNGVLYATNTQLWAIDVQTGTALGVGKTINHTSIAANVQFNAALNELYVWGDEAVAYRPVR